MSGNYNLRHQIENPAACEGSEARLSEVRDVMLTESWPSYTLESHSGMPRSPTAGRQTMLA